MCSANDDCSIQIACVACGSKDWITIRKEAAPNDASGAKSLLFSGGPTKKQPGTTGTTGSVQREYSLMVERCHDC